MVTAETWRRSLEAICIPIAALLFSLVLFGLFCVAAGTNPFEVYAAIYQAAFGSGSAFQNALIRAAPLMLTSLCTALPARLGLVIIGNEGALVIGGIAATIVGLSSLNQAAAAITQTLMAIAGMLGGGIWIGIVGALRHSRGVNETISSLLMNYIAIALLNHLVNGPMRDPSSLNKPSSDAIPALDRLGTIPMLPRVHYGLIYGIVACVVAYFLIQRTTFGFAARTAGGNIKAAKIAGLPVGQLTIAICFLAGSCAGLAGMAEIAAVQGRANESLNANYGYSGILVAFVARHNPIAASIIAILFGGILASGSILQRRFNLPDATVYVLQGLVFLVVLYSESLYGRFRIFKEPEPTLSTTVEGG
ncbi:MAG TPA: ABC transporter permease [Leptolyngbya sp.]|nr:ABC transporter permease [Leptolyngbya sp.]